MFTSLCICLGRFSELLHCWFWLIVQWENMEERVVFVKLNLLLI